MHGGLSFSVIQKILKMATTPHNASWLSVACRGQLCLAKINTAQQLACAQIPCILVNNDLPTRIYLATIRSYCFLQDSSKSLPKNYIWLKTAKKLQTMPKQRSWRGKLRPRYIVSGAIDCKEIKRIIHTSRTQHNDSARAPIEISWSGVQPADY